MEAEAKYTLVGVVVLLVAALLSLGLIWLGGWGDTIAYKHFNIYFNNQSMDGLDIDSAVKMRGIKVGAVTVLDLSSEGHGGVRVGIKVDENTPVREGAQAYVKRNVLTGLATVEIANADPSAPLLSQVPKGEKYPVIAEGSSELDNVATAVSRMAENGAEVLDKMNGVLTEKNSKALAKTLANLEDLSNYLVQNKQSLEETIQALRAAADEFRFAGASVSQAASRAEGSIAGVGNQATVALKEAATAMENLQKESSAISQKLQNLSDTGSVEITAIGRDVRTSADAITVAGRKLSNPRSLLLGSGKSKPGPGEK
jgi:phospholipid/cholesterol/gamma-HCH transport system substrate-binding protein